MNQKYSEKLCCIYRWKTENDNANLNNQDELEADLNHLSTLCDRLKNIKISQTNNNVLNKNERQRWGGYISFIEEEGEKITSNYITHLETPLNLNTATYPHFKNLVKSVYSYDTTYPETHERKTMTRLHAQRAERNAIAKAG